MRDFLRVVVVLAVGLLGGVAISLYALSRPSPFDTVRLGAWALAAHAGSMDADPYTRATLARTGEIPLALGEGLQWVARADDEGRKLDARCDYEVGPRTPAARYWTMSVVDPGGFPIANPAGRAGFRSSEVIREGDGDFLIRVSAEAQPGNWLPVGAPGPFALVLRLYDAPLGATPGAMDPGAAPRVKRTRCG